VLDFTTAVKPDFIFNFHCKISLCSTARDFLIQFYKSKKEKKMEETEKEKKPKEEQHLCQCGKPTEVKPIQAGWGNVPIQVCTDPNCPCKQERKKKKIGWGD